MKVKAVKSMVTPTQIKEASLILKNVFHHLFV